MTGLVARAVSLPRRLEPTDLDLAPGTLTCLIGPNGSGKTSLLHAIAGIGAPRGAVMLDGEDLRSVPPPRRGHLVSYLPASRDLVWPLAVRDLAALGLRAADAGERVARALALVDMAALADRRADRLSTGERSRALIARALAPEPRLLLLDEPTANLDPLWQIRLLDHLVGLARRENRILLVAMHDLEAARRCADRLLILDRGHIVADGDPDALLDSAVMPAVFGIVAGKEGWRPVSPPANRRSSP